jgi:chloramphenicol 3-O-phosphotransferase
VSEPPVLVLIVGPAAAGKSAIAQALADDLRGSGTAVARVELDAIAGMVLPSPVDWGAASSIFASVVAQWLAVPMPVVIAEGIATVPEVATMLAAVPPGVARITVALGVDFEIALARALADPTRGVTRDPAYLRRVHERWATVRDGIAVDLSLDTGERSLEDCVAAIRDAIAARR